MQPPCVSRAPPSEVLWQLRWHRPPRPASFHEDVRQLHVFRATQVSSLFTLSTTTAKDEQQSSHQRDATMMTEYGFLSRIVFLRHSGRVRVGECGQVLILHLIGAVGIKACCVSMYTVQCGVIVDSKFFQQRYTNLQQLKIQRDTTLDRGCGDKSMLCQYVHRAMLCHCRQQVFSTAIHKFTTT